MTTPIDEAGIVAAICKPLQWKDRSGFQTAQTPWGRYALGQRGEVWIWAWNGQDEPAESEAAAQAAAEADYRARIAAALDVGPILALVEAVSVTADEAMRDEIPGGYLPEESDEFHLGYDAAIKRVRAALAAFKEASHG